MSSFDVNIVIVVRTVDIDSLNEFSCFVYNKISISKVRYDPPGYISLFKLSAF